MKKAEKEHIDKVGEDIFARAVALAMIAVKGDSRLVGLDKIRIPLAEEAALQATGYERRPFIVPKGAGEPTQAIVDICQETLAAAIEAAAVVEEPGPTE